MHKIISKSQSTFIKGRSIHDNYVREEYGETFSPQQKADAPH